MKISKSFIVLFGLMGLVTSFSACSDWGKMDPAAGIDIYPTHAKTATYAFNESMDFTELEYVKSVDGGTVCEIVEDDSLNSQVLHLVDGAKVHLFNALSKSAGVTLQNAAGFTFWLRSVKDAPGTLQLTAGGQDFPLPISELLSDGYLHFMGVQARKDAFDIYADAQLLTSIANDNTELIAAINANDEIVFGSQSGEFWIDDISFIRNLFVEKDLARPTIKRPGVKLPTPVYINTFESGAGDAEIIGAGSIRDDATENFGKVFQNVAGAKSTNYLKLPSHVLSHSAESQEMTIGFWVNAVNAGVFGDYTYSPFFSAYATQPTAANGTPMFVMQSRGPLQVNMFVNDEQYGWSDFTGANHVDGKVNVYNQNCWEANDGAYNFVNNWLDDSKWHYYAVTLTATEVTAYMDGKIVNQWEFDGKTEGQIVTGLFSQGSALTWPCLGGGQAWDWGDPDAGFAYDDFVVYDKALSDQQIQRIIDIKNGNASADDEEEGDKSYVTLGNPDCNDNFWTVFSDPVLQLKDGQTAHFGFYNKTAGQNNWENWVLICTNNGDKSTGADSEYFVMRADAWAWGMGFDSPGNMTNDFDWDTFTTDINGAWVDLTAARKGSTITVTVITTTTEGKKYNTQFTYEGATAETCGLYFTLEKAYLQFDPEQCYVGEKFNAGSYVVGATDYTSGFWSEFSVPVGFNNGPTEANPLVFHFINKQNGVGSNWNNWVLCCTNNGGMSTGADSENFVLRADAWGWGSKWVDGNYTMTQSFNWDSFPADMQGAECWVGVSHEGNNVKVVAPMKKANGAFMPAYETQVGDISGQVGFFFTIDGCSLDFLDVAYYPYFNKIGK